VAGKEDIEADTSEPIGNSAASNAGNSTGSNAGTSSTSSLSQGSNRYRDTWDTSDSSNDGYGYGRSFFRPCTCEDCTEEADDECSSNTKPSEVKTVKTVSSAAIGSGSTTLHAQSTASTASCTITSASAAAAASADLTSANTNAESRATFLAQTQAHRRDLASSSKSQLPGSSGCQPSQYQDDSNMSVDDDEDDGGDDSSIKWVSWEPIEQQLQPPVSASSSSEQAGSRRKRKKKIIEPECYETAAAAAAEADDEDRDDDNSNDSVAGKSISKRRRTVTNRVSTVGIPEISPGPVRDDVKSNRQAADKWIGNMLCFSYIKTTL